MLNNAKKLFKNVRLKAFRKKAGCGNETLALILKQNFSRHDGCRKSHVVFNNIEGVLATILISLEHRAT
jgi:hypothetical protein